jgi:predicted DNA-binding transcriptional regulator YafY
MVDRLERLTNLVLFLREGRPKSLREIGDSVPGYPPPGEARRQAFERDKRTLRGGGVDITTVPVPGRDQIAYTIRTEDFYLPELELDAEEQTALNLAVAGVHLGDPSGRDALWRLGLPGSAGAQPVAQLPALPALPRLHGALRSHSTVSFAYRGENRNVDPALLRFTGGWWYLVGLDRDKGSARTFRVDRIEEEPEVGPPDSAHLPEGFDPSGEVPEVPWMVGEAEHETVEVLVDKTLAELVVAELGESTVAQRRDDSSVVVRLEVTNPDALRNWVLELGEHAQIVAPVRLRERLTGWLESIVEAPPAPAEAKAERSRRSKAKAAGRAPESLASEAAGGAQGVAGRGGLGAAGQPATRLDAGKRLHRLLAVLTWLARTGRAPVSELAERFGLSPEQLVSDLELAACCGLPPYTPDQLMEIIVDENEVVADLGPELARPRRLTAAEGFALAASAHAILTVPGADTTGALGRAAAKLDAALGDLGTLRVDLGEPRFLEAARQATTARRQVEIDYYSVSSDETSARVVDPVDVVAVDGRWYLDGYCHRARGMRRFRVDRISNLESTGKAAEDHQAESPKTPPTNAAFVPGPEARIARIAVDAAGSWVVESVPSISTSSMDDGRTEVVLGVSSIVWFERLLLRLGPHAQVLDPPELTSVGRDAARRLMALYNEAA